MTTPVEAPEPDLLNTAEMPETAEAPATPVHPWLSLKPERFQLLRLTALPAERETGLRPLRFVRLGRVERNSKAESFLRLSIDLPGQKTREEINALEVWADHQTLELRFNPDLPLQTDPANRGIGRFLFALVTQWASKHWNHYTVASQPLLIKHAPNDAARLRRDHALQAQGFSVTYDDAVQMSATCSVGRVSQLHSDWNTNKVTVIDTLESAVMLQEADKKLNEQNARINKLVEQVESLRREDGTLRFTITILAVFAVFQAALLIWIATR